MASKRSVKLGNRALYPRASKPASIRAFVAFYQIDSSLRKRKSRPQMIDVFRKYSFARLGLRSLLRFNHYPAQVSSPCARQACARNGVSCLREVSFLDAYAVVLTVISSPSTPPPKLQREGQGQQAATERQRCADSLAFATRPLADIDTLFLHQLSASYQGLWVLS